MSTLKMPALLKGPSWLALFLTCALPAWAAEEKPDADRGKETEPPATHTVAKAPLKNEVQIDAFLESAEAVPVKVEPKAWTDLTVVEAVPHGAKVKKGDMLVKLDLDKLNEQLEEQKQTRRSSKLALEIARAELENLERSTPLKMEAARRAKRQADEDYAYFQEVDRAQKEKANRFSLKNAEQRLSYASEELNQLKKMYEADDLTEETEEIILVRQKHAVEAAEFGLETTKLSTDRSLGTVIPREADAAKARKQEQGLALELTEETGFKPLQQKRLAFEKTERDLEKAEKNLADLQKDLELLNITAPMDGMVYYGAFENGKWATGGVVAKKLVPGGKLMAREIFMTVLNPNRLVLTSIVPEEKLASLTPGLKAKASPVAHPDKKLPSKLERIDSVPLPTGGFGARLSVEIDAALHLMPGMGCKVTVGGEDRPLVLAVPARAVFTEENKKLVYLPKNEGGPEKRLVKTGASDGELVEIVDGLAEGEKILLKKPE